MPHHPTHPEPSPHRWLHSGGEAFPRMLAAIDKAKHCVRLETYIFRPGFPGDAIRDALIEARKRKVEVRVLLDAYGSMTLPGGYWKNLLATGGNVRFFNPLRNWRPLVRDHRKLLVCDEESVFVGSFNITPEEAGEGVTHGWANIGMELSGACVRDFTLSFDTLFYSAGRLMLTLLLRSNHPEIHPHHRPEATLLANGPVWRRSPIRHALLHDFRKAHTEIMVISAYFLPPWRLRRALGKAVRKGCRVRLVLAGKSDVTFSKLAGQHLYHKLMRAGVEIYEYQPQILHTKLMVTDRTVYVGSANLDARSLHINCELLVRISDPTTAGEAREIFEGYIARSRRILPEQWAKSRGLWQRVKENFAYWVLARLDPHFARHEGTEHSSEDRKDARGNP